MKASYRCSDRPAQASYILLPWKHIFLWGLIRFFSKGIAYFSRFFQYSYNNLYFPGIGNRGLTGISFHFANQTGRGNAWFVRIDNVLTCIWSWMTITFAESITWKRIAIQTQMNATRAALGTLTSVVPARVVGADWLQTRGERRNVAGGCNYSFRMKHLMRSLQASKKCLPPATFTRTRHNMYLVRTTILSYTCLPPHNTISGVRMTTLFYRFCMPTSLT